MILGLVALILGPVIAFTVASVARTALASSRPAAAHTVARLSGAATLLVVTELREPQSDAPSPAATPAPRIALRPAAAAAARRPSLPTGYGPPASPGSIIAIIEAAAARWGVSGSWMVSIARCESGLRPTAVNPSGPYEGLFQFLPSTFRGNGGTNIWDPTDQSNIAAKMLAHGQAYQWSCA